MTFDEALKLIGGFWPGAKQPFGSGEPRVVARLEREFGCALPTDVGEYVARYAPATRLSLETVGNPLELYPAAELGVRAEGYNWNPVTGEPLDGWAESWLLIGDEGADPIVVDLADSLANHTQVRQAPHGEGEWEFSDLASSIPELLVLSAAQHHALSGFGPRFDAIVDDAQGFNLNEAAAEWYFPFVREVAPATAERWLYVLDNARR